MWFGVVITVMFVILYRSSLHFLCFSVSLYHFGFVLCKLVVTGFEFLQYKARRLADKNVAEVTCSGSSGCDVKP